MEKRPKKNRRLELMPEVLPAPPPPGKLNPRERTLKSLGRLAAAAAAAATLSACKEAGCGAGGGYAVVDPMPPPAQCEGLVATISAFTSWNPSGNISLKLSKPTMAGASYSLPRPTTDAGSDAAAASSDAGSGNADPGSPDPGSPDPGSADATNGDAGNPNPGDAGPALGPAAAAIRLNNGRLLSLSVTGGALVLEIAPDAGASYVSVEIPATCPAGDETVLAEIRLEQSGSPKPKLSVALYDQARY